jgi:hypothetical protein
MSCQDHDRIAAVLVLGPVGVTSMMLSRRAVTQAVPLEHRDKTGMEKGMKEPYIEGVATHGGPEPCAGVRKADGEALDRGTCRPGY